MGPVDRQVCGLVNVFITHGHSQNLRPQPRPFADRAGRHPHVAVVVFFHFGRGSLIVAAFQDGDDPFPAGVVRPALVVAGPAGIDDQFLPPVAKEDEIAGFGGQILPGSRQGKSIFFSQGFHVTVGPACFIRKMKAGDINGPALDRKTGVTDDKLRREMCPLTKTCAFGAGPIGIVETEHPGRELPKTDFAIGASQLLREDLLAHPPAAVFFAFFLEADNDKVIRQLERRFDRVRQPVFDPVPSDKPVHDYFNAVFFVGLKLQVRVKLHHFTVDPDADKSLRLELFQQARVFAFTVAYKGSHKSQPCSLRP